MRDTVRNDRIETLCNDFNICLTQTSTINKETLSAYMILSDITPNASQSFNQSDHLK